MKRINKVVPVSKPQLFFTDKDKSQIKRNQVAFQLTLCLCLWHTKRANKHELKDLQKKEVICCDGSLESKIMNMIDIYYFFSQVLILLKEVDLIQLALNELSKLNVLRDKIIVDHCSNI